MASSSPTVSSARSKPSRVYEVNEDVIPGLRAQRKEISRLIHYWLGMMSLGNYSVRWSIVPNGGDMGNNHQITAARTLTRPEVCEIQIEFNEDIFYLEQYGPEGLKVLVGHELFHALQQEHILHVAEEMINFMDDQDKVKGMYLSRFDTAAERMCRAMEAIFARTVTA